MQNFWNEIKEIIKCSKKDIQILEVDHEKLSEIIEKVQLKEGSALESIIRNTGGIIIENWIRIYGAGKCQFLEKNQKFPFSNIVIAEDIMGGIFAFLNHGTIGYFTPDTLEWEDLEISYSQFVLWCINGDTDTFYQSFRWNGWKEDIKNIRLDEGVFVYPFLWTEGNHINQRKKKFINFDEIMNLEFDIIAKLNR